MTHRPEPAVCVLESGHVIHRVRKLYILRRSDDAEFLHAIIIDTPITAAKEANNPLIGTRFCMHRSVRSCSVTCPDGKGDDGLGSRTQCLDVVFRRAIARSVLAIAASSSIGKVCAKAVQMKISVD